MQRVRAGARYVSFYGVEIGCFAPLVMLGPTLRFWWGHWILVFLFAVAPILVCIWLNLFRKRRVSWVYRRIFHWARGSVMHACPWWRRRAFRSF